MSQRHSTPWKSAFSELLSIPKETSHEVEYKLPPEHAIQIFIHVVSAETKTSDTGNPLPVVAYCQRIILAAEP